MSCIKILKQNLLLILCLGVLALTRPIMKITGLIELFGSEQFGSILMTIFISLAWLFTVVNKSVENPFLILVFAGISYAIFSIILSGILSPILLGELQGPLTNPLAIISVLVTNIIWGLIIGAIASVILNKRNVEK